MRGLREPPGDIGQTAVRQLAIPLPSAQDETGYVQPKISELRSVRGTRSVYHNNAIQSWRVEGAGEVINVQIS